MTHTGQLLAANGATPVARIGLGCMGMSEFYGPRDDETSRAALRAAVDLGYRHFDTADIYGNGHNEELLGALLRTLPPRTRQELLVASKGAIRRPADGTPTLAVDSSPAHLRAACDASLGRLGVERIDLYYVHRRTPAVPIEETIGGLAELVREGKIRDIGLSEVSEETLRRAHRVHPIAALQSEYSLWSRDVEAGPLAACAELGIALVAYSPLGRGFFSGALRRDAVQADDDLRRRLPRFSDENFERNQARLDELRAIADELGASMAATALAWVLAQAPHIHVIPGTRRVERLRDNFAAAAVTLSEAQRERLTRHFAAEHIAGGRYPAPLLATVNT